MRKVHPLTVAAAAFLLVLAGSCGDDDDATPTISPTATSTTASATATAPPGPSPSPSPSPSATPSAAQNAGSFIYVTSAGDTIDDIALAFNGQPGTAKAGFPDQIKQLNPAVAWPNPPAGTEVVVPLLQTDPGSLIPYASIQLALGIQDSGGLEVQEPTAALMDGFRGQLALHRVTLAKPGDVAAGYLAEYWLTDRRFLKGGELDREARVTTAAFIVAGGSLASQVTGGTGVFAFEQDGIPYAVKALAGAGNATAEQIASGLAVAPHQP